MPWFEPDINDHLASLADLGTRQVVIVPIGFMSDHMEVMWGSRHSRACPGQGTWAERRASVHRRVRPAVRHGTCRIGQGRKPRSLRSIALRSDRGARRQICARSGVALIHDPTARIVR